MGRYLKAEVKRIFSKTGNLISLLIVFLLVIGGNIIINKFFSLRGPIAPGSTSSAGVAPVSLMIGTSIAIRAANWMVLFVGAFVMGDERKERAYLRPIESGISRTKIVLSKFILSFVIAMLVLFAVMGLHFAIVYLLFGWSSACTEIAKYFLMNISLEIIPLMAILSILMLIYFVVRNEFLVVVLYILFGVKIHTLFLYASMVAGRFKPMLRQIASFMPSGVYDKISGSAFNALSMGAGPFTIGENVLNNLVPQLVVNAIIVVVIMGITIGIMNRRDID